jgi:NAD(P)-dependent dehydrogenase (short-subunit alcohol dehydrogenase family)
VLRQLPSVVRTIVLVDATVAENGRLDFLFNNAGIAVAGEARDFE